MSLLIPQYTNQTLGITIQNTYATITQFSGDPLLTRFTVSFYSSNPTITNVQSFSTAFYQLPTPQVTGAESLYTYLLTLPEFIGAVIVA